MGSAILSDLRHLEGSVVVELPTLDDVDSTLFRDVRVLLPTHVASVISYVTGRTYEYYYI